MAQKNKENTEYNALKTALEGSGESCIHKLYLFYGVERYMLEHFLGKIRERLVSNDFMDFNYHKFNAGGFSLDDIAAACEALPVFSERTLVEVHDFDILKANAETREKLAALTADLPEEVCLIFVSPAEELEKEELSKVKKALGKDAHIVSFDVQETSRLVKWIRKHFAELGKRIDESTAEYLSFITGGRMITLKSEIDKLAFYAAGEAVTRADIDKLVTPDPDAKSYVMTDHLVAGRFDSAAEELAELLGMQEAPHKLIFAISLKLRQLQLARLLYEDGQDVKQLMKTGNINFEFQARNLMNTARTVKPALCRRYVLLAAEAAYGMNSGSDPESQLTDLFIRLASAARGQTDGKG